METIHNQLRIQEISALLPHRYPFLLVDRVLSIEPGLSIKSLKNVTINEPFFQGHFPGEPIMPGVLILEAMGQTGIIFAKNTETGGFGNKLLVFAGMDEVRFRRQVVPGDQLIMELKLLKRKSILWKMEGKAYVNDKVAAEAILIAAVQ
ncbi:MAG: 3-hydroxyacyl-[acyl-carrier-protein] dehydratase FabZ [delta proteobacterium ML8_D]|jgi:3-hydroxyacyl-[acyl-carrier-protein] dehydratase|nr:MAG: 3-hydroxyacyl-[acyl-carrier-protein] dehydratase FabZ [delta proteobacterium ML8_D]